MSGAGASRSPIALLLEGDPAVRWQVLADVVEAPADEVRAERARVSAEGWSARLLEAQDPDGLWAGALYSPKWTSTTYTLLLLHWLGLESSDPNARKGCVRLMASAREVDGGLVLGAWTRADAHRTGDVVAEAFTRSHFPPPWHFDVVRGLEHFRAAGAACDERLTDAISIIQAAQRPDGTWAGHASYAGRYWFAFDAQERSRWATCARYACCAGGPRRKSRASGRRSAARRASART